MLHVVLNSVFFPQDIRRKQQGEIMARKGEKDIDLPSLKMQVMISKKMSWNFIFPVAYKFNVHLKL